MLSPKEQNSVNHIAVIYVEKQHVVIKLYLEILLYKLKNLVGLRLDKLKLVVVVLTRYVRRGGKLWIRIFPDKAVTMRPAGTRMGSGKGAPDYWVAVVHPGKILYEMQGVSETIARQAMRIAAYKMPVKTKFLTKTV